MTARQPVLLILFCLLTGCEESSSPPSITPTAFPDPPKRNDLGTAFAADQTTTLAGHVFWKDKPPIVPPFRSVVDPLTVLPPPPAQDWPNPHSPRLLPEGKLAGAIVWLRGITPARSRPWDHPSVQVQLRDHRLDIVQGKDIGLVGFVRAGDEVEFVSRQSVLHTIQGRGQAFFGLTLPQPDQPRRRRLSDPGVVELASGAGFFWMAGYLFVTNHPYITRSNDQGMFRLTEVPAGDYELCAWHPNWQVQREERHPETFRIHKVSYHPPFWTRQKVRLQPGKEQYLSLELSHAQRSSPRSSPVLE